MGRSREGLRQRALGAWRRVVGPSATSELSGLSRTLFASPEVLSESDLAALVSGGGVHIRSVRRALARGLLLVSPALPLPRTEADRLLCALSRLRQGEERTRLESELSLFDQRSFTVRGGQRAPAAAIAHATTRERFDLHAPDFVPGVGRQQRIDELTALAEQESGISFERAVHRLAILGGAETAARLARLRQVAGRRGEHTLLAAEGNLGSPTSLAVLVQALRARDVDPGRGFTQRRISSDGLGEIGDLSAISVLIAALDAERHDFEGRPGAGLGIQYPVRANILRALGEIGHPTALPALLAHLGDVSGSAFGGFYLPAMDAIVKLGPSAIPGIQHYVSAANSPGREHGQALVAVLEGETK